jgi:UDP-N-acetyl-D-mannosaminuronic acid dehydrogenase
MQTVCVLGLGYIGLPTASVLATSGFEVLGVDVNARVVETVNAGKLHIEEPGLQTVVSAAIQSKRLRAATSPEPSDVFIIAVPTPLTGDNRADMSHVEAATRELLPHLRKGNLVILESTSPPGTCRDVLVPILETTGLKVGADVHLAHCPERVLPGRILKEFIDNDRVVGGIDTASAERARDFYARFVAGRILLTDVTTAELVKVLENTFRDVNIALANEVALMCEGLGINFHEAASLANHHPRVNVHRAGPGVGGHCISVDPWFLADAFPDTAKLVQLARERNDGMPDHVVARVQELVSGIEAPRIAALGLAFKGDVDDLRNSPSVAIVERLIGAGLDVRVHDPLVKEAPFPTLALDAALEGADVVVLLTDHSVYRELDPAAMAGKVRTKKLYDSRGVLDRGAWEAAGFAVTVLGVGR